MMLLSVGCDYLSLPLIPDSCRKSPQLSGVYCGVKYSVRLTLVIIVLYTIPKMIDYDIMNQTVYG